MLEKRSRWLCADNVIFPKHFVYRFPHPIMAVKGRAVRESLAAQNSCFTIRRGTIRRSVHKLSRKDTSRRTINIIRDTRDMNIRNGPAIPGRQRAANQQFREREPTQLNPSPELQQWAPRENGDTRVLAYSFEHRFVLLSAVVDRSQSLPRCQREKKKLQRKKATNRKQGCRRHARINGQAEKKKQRGNNRSGRLGRREKPRP